MSGRLSASIPPVEVGTFLIYSPNQQNVGVQNFASLRWQEPLHSAD
jgi:hypothetical protein